MKNLNKKLNSKILPVVFGTKEVRRTWHNEQWYFVIEDIVQVLIESLNPKDYIQKMKIRDPELSQGYGQIVHTLDIPTKGGVQKMNCANLQGVFRIIQSISSPKAEPFKQWLAKVGGERIEEMQNPEIALNRGREYWKKHGRSEKWIQQRMMGQETRNKLTDYWKESGVKEGGEFAILTNIIHEEWSGLSVQDHKNIKSLNKTNNLRDHMSEAELIFTALAELSTRQIAESEQTKGLEDNKIPAKRGGKIAKDARLALEEKTGKRVISGDNYLPRISKND
ncbi:MAG: Bro-N domain-containing protein [bacterium]|nr:Bro-N domain-containing protein [bacterium]